MTITVPKWLRATLYIAALVGTPVERYLEAKGVIGSLEVTLWDAEVIVAATVATLHLSSTKSVNLTAPATVEVTEVDDNGPEFGEGDH